MKRKIFFAFLILLIGVQFIPIDKQKPNYSDKQDFLEITEASSELKTLIKNACYDCHSHQTEYPWYSSVAPISFLVVKHIEEGREHLNFSTWSHLNTFAQQRKLEECIEEIEEGEMPLLGYRVIHFDAQLSQSDKDKLISFFKSLN